MTKDELLGIYRKKLNHIQLTYASLVLWSYPDTPELFEKIHSNFERKLNLFPMLTAFLNDKTAMKIACEELYASAHRSALKELLPLTKLYCHKSNQLGELKKQEWFSFWSIIRNCWAHDMIFNFNKHEKSKLPINWRGATIDITMNGKQLTHGSCSYEQIRELLEAAQNYVYEDLA
jgi:hypothetical protein